MMDWAAVEGIVYSEEDHPHDILGAHVTEEGILIQTFLPTAKSVTVVLKDSKKEYPMDLEDEEGFFAALLPGKRIPKYHYHVDFGEEADGKENIVEYEDPYRFAPQITEKETKKFNAGICYDIYEKLGSHPMTVNGVAGGILALLGVVAAPITSGDTALRSARLIIAEFIGLEQRSMRKRLYICVPLFAFTVGILVWQMENPDGFNIIWQYFGWANQTLSVFTLWTLTVYLVQQKKPFVMTLVPALFMTVICSTFLLISPTALALGESLAYTGSVIILVIALVWFLGWYRSYQKKQ